MTLSKTIFDNILEKLAFIFFFLLFNISIEQKKKNPPFEFKTERFNHKGFEKISNVLNNIELKKKIIIN